MLFKRMTPLVCCFRSSYTRMFSSVGLTKMVAKLSRENAYRKGLEVYDALPAIGLMADTAITNAAISACDKGLLQYLRTLLYSLSHSSDPAEDAAREQVSMHMQRLYWGIVSIWLLTCLHCAAQVGSGSGRWRYLAPWRPRGCGVTPSPTPPPFPRWPRASSGASPCRCAHACTLTGSAFSAFSRMKCQLLMLASDHTNVASSKAPPHHRAAECSRK